MYMVGAEGGTVPSHACSSIHGAPGSVHPPQWRGKQSTWGLEFYILTRVEIQLSVLCAPGIITSTKWAALKGS